LYERLADIPPSQLGWLAATRIAPYVSLLRPNVR